MSTTKVVDSMRDVTTVDGTKVSGAVPAAALSNVDLVEGTKGSDIASAGTMVIGTDGGYFDITGTTGISTMTVAAGRVFTLQFDGAVTLTHSSTLYLSGAADFTTEANDHMTFISVAANDVRQIGTGLKDGGSSVAAAGGALIFLEEQVASTSSTVLLSVTFDTTYDVYLIVWDDLVHSTSSSFHLRTRLTSGSSIDTSTSYANVQVGIDAGTAATILLASDDGVQAFAPIGTNGAVSRGSGFMYIQNMPDAEFANGYGQTCYFDGGNDLNMTSFGWMHHDASATDGIQFHPSSGTFTTGNFRLYGVSKS